MHLVWQHPPATGNTLVRYDTQCIHAKGRTVFCGHIPTGAFHVMKQKKIRTDIKQIIHSKFKPMKRNPLFVALSNPKGGMEKSTFTVLLASYFHCLNGYNVLVVNCDYPQHSISAMRDKEVGNIEKNVHLRCMLCGQFDRTCKKVYPVLAGVPGKELETTLPLTGGCDHSLF